MKEKEINQGVQELKKYQKKYSNHQKYITDNLLEIYQNNHMDLEYKKELYNAFSDYDKFNFKKYTKIKKLYGKKDWVTEKE